MSVVFTGRVGRNWQRTGNQAVEEGLASKVLVVLLKVLLGRGDELDGSELEATVLEARDDGANEATLDGLAVRRHSRLKCVGNGNGDARRRYTPGRRRA
jgi:hypothetical protein